MHTHYLFAWKFFSLVSNWVSWKLPSFLNASQTFCLLFCGLPFLSHHFLTTAASLQITLDLAREPCLTFLKVCGWTGGPVYVSWCIETRNKQQKQTNRFCKYEITGMVSCRNMLLLALKMKEIWQIPVSKKTETKLENIDQSSTIFQHFGTRS